jgi:anthranilate 1,2-dioxygenase (deaminating, decarboxylating) large subunit
MKRLSLVVCLVVLGALGARGYDQPSVNLGATSFLDGAPPAGPGWYFTEYLQYYHAQQFRDLDPEPNLGVFASLNQLIYQSNQKRLFGGKWGVNLILPVVAFQDSSPLPSQNGLGDLEVGPFLQWDPIMRNGAPFMFNRLELTCIVPTGSYDRKDVLNAGSNFFSFNPYWSATILPAPKWEVSWRLHYLFNGINDDPFVGFAANSSQPGQAIHLNFATSYEVVAKQLRLGISGYYFKQVTQSKMNGINMSGMNEQVLGIGPGLLLSFSQNDHLFLNAYFETAAENRTEGQRVVVRWVHHF